MSLGANIKQFRIRKGESLQDVADAVGMSKPHLWQLETGDSKNPTLQVLQKLAKHFETTIAVLLGEKESNMVFGREFKGRVDDDTKDVIVKMAEKLID